MPLKFYIGPSGSGKTHSLYRHIIEESLKNPDASYIVVAPEQFTMRTQRELVMMHPNGGIMNIDVLSFGRLSYRIFEETGSGNKMVLDDIAKSLILRKLASEHEEELEVLGRDLKKLGYIDEVKSLITEFLQYGVGEEGLQKLIGAADSRKLLQCKLKDILILYQSFRKSLSEKYITAEELLDTAGDVMEKSDKIRQSIVAFDGFTGFTPVQNQFLLRLIQLCKQVYITVTMGAGENPYLLDGEQKLFYLGKKTISSLERLMSEAGMERRREQDIFLREKPVFRYQDRPGLAFLEENLFRYGRKVKEGEQDEIRIFAAADPLEEMRRICVEIRRLVREEGCRYRDIAVVTGDMENYASYAKRMFKIYAIPCFIDQNRGILLNPLIEYIRAGLRILLENYSYESVFHFARAGFWPMERELTDLAENYVLARGVRGRSRWKKEFPLPKKGFDPEEMERINRFRERLLENLSPLNKVMSSKREMPVREMTEAVYAFLDGEKVQLLLAEYEKYFAGEGMREKEKEFHQIYKLVIDLLDKLAELLGEERMPPAQYAQLLDAGFSEMEVGLIPSGIDQVLIGDIERTRLNQVRILFFAGVNDGVVPKAGNRGGILSEHDRELLKGRGIELAPGAREQAFTQRFYLYMNMTKPADRLYLSYSRVSGNGESRNPSYLIGEVRRLFPDILVREYEKEFSFEEIAAPADGLTYLAAAMRDTGMDEGRIKELFAWYLNSEEYQDLTRSLSAAACGMKKSDWIGRLAARSLYGEVLENSITRLERYAACAYAHFLRYGLLLKERDMYTLEARDIGTIFHACLQYFSEEMEREGLTFADMSGEQTIRLSGLALDRCVREYGEDILGSSARNGYMVERIRRILARAVRTLCVQARKGDFTPRGYEVVFPGGRKLESSRIVLPDGGEIRMQGRIDRVDVLEEDERVYVKIIDYKSGEKDLNLEEICQGLKLQLLVYMNAAMELEKERRPDREVIPAGLLYYHIDDPLVDRQEGDGREQIEEKLMAKLRMTGMVNEDRDLLLRMDRDLHGRSDVIPVRLLRDGSLAKDSSVFSREEFQALSRYVRKKIEGMGREILDGSIAVNPLGEPAKGPCVYCEYQEVCGMASASGEQKARVLKKRSREEIWDEIYRETAEDH